MRRLPSSWNSTLAKLGFKLKPRTNKRRNRDRQGGFGRRSSLEQLESRELLTSTPWAGTDLVIGDFDGDGNLDRLGSMAVSGTGPEIWSIDTKASSAAGGVENWRVTRTNGGPVAGTLPALNQFVVGDFNGDRRDDILARTGASSWYVIQSRASATPGTYQGEFVISTWGTLSTSGGWSTPVVGDFNGDGRDDLAAFNDSNPADKQWQVATSTGTAFNAPVAWESQATLSPTAGSITAGDFNGDGRDDLLFKKSGTNSWAIAVSDGSRFNVVNPAIAVSTYWNTGYVGDFSGDGSDELLVWNVLGRWETVNYDDHRGLGLETTWGMALTAGNPLANIHIGDANRDGRDDLVAFNSAAEVNKWQVALSQQPANGTNSFVFQAAAGDGTNDWDRWFKDWDWGPSGASYKFLNVDAPYQHFLDVFSDVYNTVELELYPGLMKGIEATDQTNAGNDWDQAALLVDRLEAAGFDADIAFGTVTANGQQAALWVGTKTVGAAYSAIKGTVDANAILLGDGSIRFKHAWVRAIVPMKGGFVAVNVDPSWKFKDRQPGVSGTPSAFDEFGYLSQNGNALPVEYFEDQVMAHLTGTPLNESLAEVPYDGPILQRQFSAIPNSLEVGVAIYDSNPVDGNDEVEQYENLAEIANDGALAARLSHRATISLSRELNSDARTTSISPPASFVFGGDYPPGAVYIESAHTEWYEMPSGAVAAPVEQRTRSEFATEFNPSGQNFRLDNDEHYVAFRLDEPYSITPSTRIRIDLQETRTRPDGAYFSFGYDSDLSAVSTPSNGELYPYVVEDNNDPRTVIFDPTRHGFDIQYIVVGHYHHVRPAFGNILIYEDRGTTGEHTHVNNTSGEIVSSQADYASLAIGGEGLTVTPTTLLEVEFKTDLLRALHGIGWDVDEFSGNNSGQASTLHQLAGTQAYSGYLTNFTVAPSTDGYSKYRIPIGSKLTGSESAFLRRIVFHTDTGTTSTQVRSYFRSLKLLSAADAGTTGEHWTSTPISIPTHSLSSINIDYVKAENSPATAGDDSYRSRLWINGAIAAEGTSAEILQTGDRAKVRVQHQSPTEFGISPPSTVADKTYVREPGQILAISFDANQYSREYLVGLQAGLNARLEDGDDVSDIDELLSYTAAKYWYQFNRSNRTVDSLMHTIGGQQWVGSGIVTADPYLLDIPDTAIAHLQFPIVPQDMGVDLPNVTHVSFDVNSGTRSNEAFQLMSFNSSALENAILEEVVNSESISTARGLQRAYANQRGLRFDNSTISREAVQVFDSVPDAGGRTIYFRGEVGYSSVTPYVANRTNLTRTRSQLLSSEDGGLKNHINEAARIADVLENVGDTAVGTIRILVPRSRSQLGDWTGTVYVAEFDTATGKSGAYIISPDGGAPSSGGYIGNVAKPENKTLPAATFVNQTYAGDPVNVANGNMFRDEVDFKFANPIIPLDFTRHYDSQNKLDVGFGVGWVHGFTGFVYEEQDPADSNDKDYVWLRGNGERHTFENLNFNLPNTLFGDVESTGPTNDKRLTAFKDKSGTHYLFEAISTPFIDATIGKKIFSRLVAIKDATGFQGLTINYESANSVRVKEVHSLSTPTRYLEVAYNANNTIDVKRFDAGQLLSTWAYVLSTNAGYTGKRLSQVKQANLSSIVTTYSYYTDGPSARKGLIKQITEPNGELHAYEYYASGRVFRVTDGAGNQQSFNYNLFRNLTEFTDERGHVETYIHQDNGLLTKQIHDDRSRLEFTWGPQSSGGSVEREEFLMQTSTDERGGQEVFVYYSVDPNNSNSRPGELFTSRSKDGILTTYEYEVHPYVSSVKKITVTPPTGPATITAQYTHDTNGNVLTATDAAHHTTSYEYYDSTAPVYLRGLRKSETQPKGVAGQALSSWETNEAVPWEILTNSVTIIGDKLSVQLVSSGTTGEWVRADAIRIDRIDDDYAYTRIVDDITGGGRGFRLESATYTLDTDGAYGGNYVRFSGGTAQPVATWVFDDLQPGSYRVSATWPHSTANDPSTTYHIYDGLPDGSPNQLTSSINQLSATNDFRSYQTIFEYDTAGNVTRAVTEGLPARRRAYDSFGNVVYEEDATGVATAYSYDALGRLISSGIVGPKSIPFSPDRSSAVKSWSGPGGTSYDVDKEAWKPLNNGDTLYLYGDTRKAVAINRQITANTVLEFDFQATEIGEYQAIAIGDSLTTDVLRGFKLAGKDPNTYGPTWFSVTSSYQLSEGVRHYQIRLGDTYGGGPSPLIGTRAYLIFVNSDSHGPNYGNTAGKSLFTNVRIYETPDNPQRILFPIDLSSSVLSYQGPIPAPGYDVQPNQWEVLNGGETLHLTGDTRKAVPINHTLAADTVLEFDFEAPVDGDYFGIALGHSLTANHPTNLAFHLGGADPQDYGWNAQFKNYVPGSGIKHYRIPIGQFATGDFNYLIFTNADTRPTTSPGAGHSYFSNVRVYETPQIDKVNNAYDPSGRLKTTTDALGRTTTFRYDANGRLTTTIFADNTFTTHDYDEIGNCIAVSDELGRTTHYVYDDRNRLIQTIFADGSSSRTRYDGAGQVIAGFDELNHANLFTYDVTGRLLTTTAAVGTADVTKTVNKYDNRGRLVESVDGRRIVTKYQFDDLDRVIQTTVLDSSHASPNETTLTFVQTSKRPIQVTTVDYDSNGRVARTSVFDPRKFSAGDIATLLGSAKELIDAALIGPAHESANNVQVVRTTWDAFGQVTNVSNADGTTRSTVHDAAGRVRFTLDELGRRTEQQYDAFGRLEKVIQPDPDGAGPGERPYQRYIRDARGLITREWEYVGPGHSGTADLYETPRTFFYDIPGRMIRRIDKYDVVSTDFVYDVAGQIVSTVDPNGNASYTTYDKRGRVTAQREADPDGAGPQFAPVTKSIFDAAGNVIVSIDPLGNAKARTYDALNRLRTESENYTVIGDDAPEGNASFEVSDDSMPITSPTFAAYGGDATTWQTTAPSPRYADWKFGNLEPGNYRISLTWLANLILDPQARLQIEINGNFLSSFVRDGIATTINFTTIDQRKSPADFRSVHGDQELNWEIVADSISLTASDMLTVRLSWSGTANTNLLADAVRLDRIVSSGFAYDKNGNLVSETDTRGFVKTYAYDELGRQIRATTPDPDGTGVGNLSLVTESVFDGFGNRIQTLDKRSLADVADDRTTTFEYDRRNRLVKSVVDAGVGRFNVTTEFEYDAAGNTTLQTNSLEQQTHYRYDDLNRRIDEYQGFGEGRETVQSIPLSSANVSSYGIDNLLADSVMSFPGANSIQLSGFAWKGVTVSHTLKHNSVLEFEFRGANEAEAQVIGFDTDNGLGTPDQPLFFKLFGTSSSLNYQTEFRREVFPDGTVRFHIPVGQYLSDAEKASGLAITRIVLINYESRTFLDPADKGTSTFSNIKLYESDEIRTVTTYDLLGNAETIREASDPRNITTRHFYDRLNRLVRTDVDDGGLQEVRHTTVYDNVGNVKTERNETAGTETVHDYDRLYRRIKTTQPNPDPNSATPNGLVDTFTYDAAGNLILEINGEFETTRREFNAQGRVIAESDGNGDETRYRYDSEGNLLAVTDAEDNTTSYKYDRLNRVVTETNAFGTRSYTYNQAGNLERRLDRNDRLSILKYDALDRQIEEFWFFGNAGATGTARFLTWKYDLLDRVIKQVDSNLAVYTSGITPNTSDDIVDTFVYDGLGRLIEQRNYDPASIAQGELSGVPRSTQTYRYQFEPTSSTGLPPFHDRRYREQFVGVSQVPVAGTLFEYDRHGRLSEQEDYDLNAAAGVTPELKHLLFDYNSTGTLHSTEWLGNRLAGTWSSSATASFDYDRADRLKSLSFAMPSPSAPALVTHAYAYDNASRVTSFNTTGSGATTRGFGYDDAGQLTSKNGGTSESYAYDDNGNRQTVGGQSIVTGLANRLTDDGTYTYTYDKEGNITKRTLKSDTTKTTEYVWDHRNRLTAVVDKNGATITQQINYTYDVAGRRVKRVHDSNGAAAGGVTSESFIYDGDELAMRFGNAGELTHRYMYGPASDEALIDEVFDAVGESTEVLWLVGDHQGTVRDIVNDDGWLRKHVDYDSFGKVTNEVWYDWGGFTTGPSDDQAIEQLFYYTGQERDAATGLQHHGARWYNPRNGRWLSEDPIGFDGGDPNLYRYVGNSTLNEVDPTGLSQAGNPLVNLGKSIGHSVYTVGSNLVAASPGRINEFVGLANNFSNLSSQISTLQSKPVQAGRYADVAQQARNRQLGALTSERGVTYGNATNLLNNLLFGSERVDISYNPGGTQHVSTDQALHDGGGYWNGVGEVGKGYGDAAVDTVQGLYNVARHPINTIQGVGTAFAHPILTGQVIYNDIYEKSQTLRGQGSIAGDILGGFATGGIAKAVKEAGLVGKITSKISQLTNKLSPVEDAQIIVERVAQQQADKGLRHLGKYLSEAEQLAYAENPAAGARYLGKAVHEATNKALEKLYGGKFKYNTIGPDFLDTATKELIELTTPGQVAKHVAKGGAYIAAKYATYVLPK